MNLREWRNLRSTGEEKILPSGLVVRLRRVGILDLAEQGRIPAPLAGVVQSVIDKKEISIDLAEFGKFAGVINLVVGAAMMDPPVADVADETHIAVGELPVDDRMSVFNWCNEVGSQLEPFRQKPDGAVGAA